MFSDSFVVIRFVGVGWLVFLFDSWVGSQRAAFFGGLWSLLLFGPLPHGRGSLRAGLVGVG